MLIADLHCHTNASDGELDPQALYERACEAGVELLAITDHDTLAGTSSLLGSRGIQQGKTRLIAGVEFSSYWEKTGVHIVALNIDPAHNAMVRAVEHQQSQRMERARTIADKLAKRGVSGAFEAALAHSKGAAPCRPHFAQVLIERGEVSGFGEAFDKYLGNRRMRGLNVNWPDYCEVVGWIREAGGVAVLAHPEAYGLTRSKLWRLAADFAAAGGQGVELAAPGSPAGTVDQIERLCREHRFYASVGSDFHSDKQHWRKLGRTASIPADISPVWQLWQG